MSSLLELFEGDNQKKISENSISQTTLHQILM